MHMYTNSCALTQQTNSAGMCAANGTRMREQERQKWRQRETEAIEREGIYLEC